jgi:hypothetical protein
VPHGINSDEFKPISKNDSLISKLRKEYFGDIEYNFIIAFNSRNAHRKHPSNLIMAFKSFCSSLTPDEAKKCALIMHTDKVCEAGTDLPATVQAVCPEYKIVIDESRRSPEEMVAFYNLADVTANISSNEGFGLSIAESIMCGTPVISTVTGGLQDQIGLTKDDGSPIEFDLDFSTNVTGRYKKHGVWAKPVWTKVQNLQGSPPTPYIMDDLVNYTDVADAIMYWYLIGNDKREQYGLEGRRWAMNEGGINAKNMCNQFIKAMDYTLENFTPSKMFDIYTEIDYDIKNLPQGKLGFDLYKIDIEKIKKDIE